MTRRVAWLVHLSTIVVGVTGLVYAWMLYFAEPADEFAIVNHPWQPHVLHLHVLAAPVCVFAVALIWRNHVWDRVRRGFPHRRATGLCLFASFVPMAASGYLLQTSVDETWRAIWMWLHLATSAVWLVAYGVHQLRPRSEPAN